MSPLPSDATTRDAPRVSDDMTGAASDEPGTPEAPPPPDASALERLTSFDVVPHYERKRTSYAIVDPEGQTVAEMRKDTGYMAGGSLKLFVGSELDRHVGWINEIFAVGPDGARLGMVGVNGPDDASDHTPGVLRFFGFGMGAGEELSFRTGFVFEQVGLPAMEARPADPVRRVLPNLLRGFVPGEAVAERIRFSAPGSDGFELYRPAGLQPTYSITIHDDRVSRILVLSVILRVSQDESWNPKQLLVDYTTTDWLRAPFRIGPGRKDGG